MNYQEFLTGKRPSAVERGFEPEPMPSHLFPHQVATLEHNIRCGSAGAFLDTGLGKTMVELEWARQCANKTNGKALILTPLAVARQIEREGLRFGYQIRVIRDSSEAGEGINVCNYDRIDKLDPNDFGAAALDESGIIKNFSGKITRQLIQMFGGHRFRLSSTATPAPNDHMELGQHAEFCGVMQSNEMLSMFFINDTSQASQAWRLKRHGVDAFWDWMASWSRMAQMPSDLGFSDEGFELPPLNVHTIRTENAKPVDGGDLFGGHKISATDMHRVKRLTSDARAEAIVRVIFDYWQTGLSACGNQNTQRRAELSTSLTLQNESGERPNHDLPLKTANTCAPTTKTTKSDTSSPRQKKKTATEGVESDTQPTQSTEESSLPTQKHGPTRTTTSGNNASGLSMASATSNTEKCSLNKMEDVQSAVLLSEPQTASRSQSIIATSRVMSEGFSAGAAIQDSAYSLTNRNYCAEPWTIFCDTDYEQDLIEQKVGAALGPGSFFSVRGSQDSSKKEQLIDRWLAGERPILISKPSIVGYGMNFQHCCKCIFAGRTFSYESWYQAVRRFWRFGQANPVDCYVIAAEGEDQIARVIDRKANDHSDMKSAMAKAMRRAREKKAEVKAAYTPKHKGELPTWLKSAA